MSSTPDDSKKTTEEGQSPKPIAYTDYEQPIECFYSTWNVWEGDRWLSNLRRRQGHPNLGQMPEHQRLVAAAVEAFPGRDYSLHLIPPMKALPRPQWDMWVIYAPGRSSQSLVYPTEQQARWALHALVIHDVLGEMPFNCEYLHRYFPPEQLKITALTHVERDGQVVGYGCITSYLPGNWVVCGLMNDEPFAVNLDGQDDDGQARRILADRLGGALPLDLRARRAEIENRPPESELGDDA